MTNSFFSANFAKCRWPLEYPFKTSPEAPCSPQAAKYRYNRTFRVTLVLRAWQAFRFVRVDPLCSAKMAVRLPSSSSSSSSASSSTFFSSSSFSSSSYSSSSSSSSSSCSSSSSSTSSFSWSSYSSSFSLSSSSSSSSPSSTSSSSSSSSSTQVGG